MNFKTFATKMAAKYGNSVRVEQGFYTMGKRFGGRVGVTVITNGQHLYYSYIAEAVAAHLS